MASVSESPAVEAIPSEWLAERPRHRRGAPGAPDNDIERYAVVRVADEIVVDVMKAACGVEYAEAERIVHDVSIEGVRIPFASPLLLWRTKQTIRDKDRLDRTFLQSVLSQDEMR
jgi:hypothetical protein